MSLKNLASKFASEITKHGKIEKLTMSGYSDDSFGESSKKGSFSVQFNPTNLNLKLQIDRTETKTPGDLAAKVSYVKTPSQDFTFDFIIDGTGFEGTSNDIENPIVIKDKTKFVTSKVSELLNIIYRYEGEIHQPNYIKIVYGAINLKCVLSTIDVTYTLFDKSGAPLRAKINVSFKTTGNKALQDIIGNAQSPDLTHIRELKQHDHFLHMSNKMYDDNLLYVQVARANNMNSIRENKTGKRIVFPPIIEQENNNI